MDRGTWWATDHGVAKSQTGLRCLGTHTQQLIAITLLPPVLQLMFFFRVHIL